MYLPEISACTMYRLLLNVLPIKKLPYTEQLYILGKRNFNNYGFFAGLNTTGFALPSALFCDC